ncbi:hypothetical protein SSBR45G_46670 [Bradyrhizobium sp. SSBR45G]|nr:MULTISPECIES: hypothetical protein [unclassified Bradyrhizobium]GLH79758.1 hypothetical protein SSBR45G_46670 [Bradyrhizobium sp. SSBR45G]GLH87124.1 hypothetical protein SSBR45R_45840 [Bradyrhizobium sp. SSBR45R]
MEILVVIVVASFLILAVRLAWQLACLLVPVLIVAALLHGCTMAGGV